MLAGFNSPGSVSAELRVEEPWPETIDEFRELVRKYQHCLVNFAFRHLGNVQDSEDVVQGVFVKVFKGRGKRSKIRRVRPYLYRMVANASVDFLRVKKPVEVALEKLPDGGASTDRDGVNTHDAVLEIERIERLLSCLPDKQAEVVRLLIIDRMGPSDVAEMLGCSVNTVKSRFRYGIEKLRKKVGSQGRLKK